jgi:hypothetical protein
VWFFVARKIGIGFQDFERLIESGCFYVDKTDFIREWWENEDCVTLITRPRRFGKTLNMSMLECFFSNKYAGRGDLFQGLSIWEDEKYRGLQGTYPVISLSFASVKDADYESMKYSMRSIIGRIYGQHRYLLDGDALTSDEKRYYVDIENYRGELNDVEYTRALNVLSEYMYRYFGKKAVILLDEYDTPMQEAYLNGYWDEMVAFIRNLFNSTFKNNPYLDRGIMTGITRVSKESIFSDLNNLKVVTTTSDEYATSFGLTEEEVFVGLDEYGMSGEKQKTKDWYDGFTFGSHRDIYNPWSVLNLLDTGRFEPYWANTSANGLVNSLVREGAPDVKQKMGDLLEGKNLDTCIDEQIVFNQLDDAEDALWSLLLAGGYLRVVSCDTETEDGVWRYELALTNHEVRLMFRNMIKGWFKRDNTSYNGFVKALLAGDLDAMNEYMNDVALNTFSYFDTGTAVDIDGNQRQRPERFYHGFVLGLLVSLGKDYELTSNRESGFGRYDVMIVPRDGERDAFILEFKVRNARREETLDDTVAAALAQIEEKQYEASLAARGIPKGRIRKYGFAFEGKRVLIG